jgi:hypothetical protein
LASSTDSRLCTWQSWQTSKDLSMAADIWCEDASRAMMSRSSIDNRIFFVHTSSSSLGYLDGHEKHHALFSSKSLIFQLSTLSSIVRTYVLNTILSYHTVAAALAFACQGPRPPSLACCLLSQKPKNMSVMLLSGGRMTYKSPSSVDSGLSLHTNISVVLHWPWLLDASRHLVRTTSPDRRQV